MLIAIFGKSFSEKELIEATDTELQDVAKHMKRIFELDETPTFNVAKDIIAKALMQ
ncbi:hypothetical protein [Psychromonas algicola]|uniref:hypothetical protein n=1 Tax=Psychromonas algicola TaxID=2555642 RepID=UPI001419B706|nr:hypothetical protein [Psychromonas sp. RZ5]